MTIGTFALTYGEPEFERLITMRASKADRAKLSLYWQHRMPDVLPSIPAGAVELLLCVFKSDSLPSAATSRAPESARLGHPGVVRCRDGAAGSGGFVYALQDVRFGANQIHGFRVGSGDGPHIKLFKVTDLAIGTVTQLVPGSWPITPRSGGAGVAATTDAAGNVLIVTGVGPGGGLHVKVFQVTDLTTGTVVAARRGLLRL